MFMIEGIYIVARNLEKMSITSLEGKNPKSVGNTLCNNVFSTFMFLS